jgi:hypothetical protein
LKSISRDRASHGVGSRNANDAPPQPDDEGAEHHDCGEACEAQEEARLAEGLVDLSVERLQAPDGTAQAEELEDGYRPVPVRPEHHRDEVGRHGSQAEKGRHEHGAGDVVDAQPDVS